MKRALLLATLLCGCAHVRLEHAGDAMIRVERGAESVAGGVIVFKEQVKAECIAQDLATEAERARCVERAAKALQVSEIGIAGIKAALVSFWELYGVLQSNLLQGGRLTGADLAELAARGATAADAYAKLVAAIKEAKS